MNIEERLQQLEESNTELKKELNAIKFRLDLIANKTNTSQVLYDYEVNHEQYEAIMDLMDEIRKKLDAHENCSDTFFESRMKKIFPDPTDPKHDYHFAEEIAQAFMEDGRWEEVFPALYGNEKKFQSYFDNLNKRT